MDSSSSSEGIKQEPLVSDICKELLYNPFLSRPSKEQHSIVKTGRATPELRYHPRHFSRDRYYIHPWLSGSATLNCIVCWPCLLFKPDPNNMWTSGRFNQLNTFTQSAQGHQCAPEHAEALIQYNIFEQSVRHHELQYIQHNEDVQKNRDILRRLIDICSLISQNFSLGRADQAGGKTSNAELLQYITPLDDNLQIHLNNAPVFIDTSYNIQDNILSAINAVMDNTIRQEVGAAKFVAVIVDQVSDVRNKSQLALSLRYVSQGQPATVRERLLGLYNASPACTPCTVLSGALREFSCTGKLVAHAYDGASVGSAELRAIQAMLGKCEPNAVLVHCVAHELTHVMRDSLAHVPQCKVFFSVVSSIASLFIKSERHAELLTRLAGGEAIAWRREWSVNIVHGNRAHIITLLEQIVREPDEWDSEAISAAKQLINTMFEFEFAFLLELFAPVFERMYTMYSTLKEGCFHLGYCSRVVSEAVAFLNDQYNRFDEIYDNILDEVGPPAKRQVAHQIRAYYRQFHVRIVDCLKQQLEQRFSYIIEQKLQFNGLVDPSQFAAYSKSRLDVEIKMLRENFEPCFDFGRLRTELHALYKKQHLYNKTLVQLRTSGELSPQVSLLTDLVLTIPTTGEGATEPSHLSRILRYCAAVPRDERRTALAKMAVETELMADIKDAAGFHENVIDEFVKLVQRDEFTYK